MNEWIQNFLDLGNMKGGTQYNKGGEGFAPHDLPHASEISTSDRNGRKATK